MTIESNPPDRASYSTNGTTGPWTVPFSFAESEHLEVIYTDSSGNPTTLAYPADYTVAGAGDPSGGTVTTTTAYGSGGYITIIPDVPLTQLLDYLEGDAFPAESHEAGLDKLTRIARQFSEKLDRVLVYGPADTVISQIPSVSARASRLAGWDSTGAMIGVLPSSGDASALALDLLDGSNTSKGDAYIAVNRTDLTGSSSTTQHEFNRGAPVIAGPLFGIVEGTGLSSGQRTSNGTKLNAAISASKGIKSAIQLPAGPLEYDGTLIPLNGVPIVGFGNMGEDTGSTFHGTTLLYFGTGDAVNLVGTSASVGTRKQTMLRDLTIKDGGGATGSRGVVVGWNMRAMPLLCRVTIVGFGAEGLYFSDYNWNVSFDHLRVDSCGTRTAGSSGIGKNPAIDSGTFNAINFHNLQVEGSGTATSVAGGIYMPSTGIGNRALSFTGECIIEGNAGTAEVYISNMMDLVGTLYMERTTASSRTVGVQLHNCTGTLVGGFISGESTTHDMSGASGQKILTFAGVAPITDGVVGQLVLGSGIAEGSRIASVQAGVGFTLDTNTTGTLSSTSVRYGFPEDAIKLTGGSDVIALGTTFSGWVSDSVRAEGSTFEGRRVRTNTPNASGYSGDATATFRGDQAPRMSVSLSADQTGVASGVFTTVLFNTETLDSTAGFNNATGEYTPKNVGQYRCYGSVTFASAADQDELIAMVYRNGSALKLADRDRASGTGSHTLSFSVMVDCAAATDVFTLRVRHTSGSNKTVTSGVDTHWAMEFAG